GFYFVRRSDSVELSFWMLFWSSLLLSASIVYFDDGNRVLAASQPLIALFFAAGFGNPSLTTTARSPHAKLTRYTALALVAAAVLFVSTPWLVHRFYSAADAQPEARSGEAFVFGGRRMSGFLVVDDN